MKNHFLLITVLVLCLCLVLGLTACAGSVETESQTAETIDSIAVEEHTTQNELQNALQQGTTNADYYVFSDNLTYSESAVVTEFRTKGTKTITLAENGSTDYSVIYPIGADSVITDAATYFCSILNTMVGNNIFNAYPEGDTSIVAGNPAIYVGSVAGNATEDADKSELTDSLVTGGINDGYIISSDSDDGDIHIVAYNQNGLANALYAFPESYLEVMYARTDFTYIPSTDTIYLPTIDRTVEIAAFDWRMVHYAEALYDSTWYKRLQLSGHTAGGGRFGWATGWCHTAYNYIGSNPPEEYFALINGKRKAYDNDGDPTQLCYSNFLTLETDTPEERQQHEEAYQVIHDNMQSVILENPGQKYFDFSMMDNGDYCECERCKYFNQQAGYCSENQGGAMHELVNKLAKDFPDVTICTLAYFDMVYPPQNMTADDYADNIQITLCTMKFGQMYSYLDGQNEQSKEFREIISGWGELGAQILIWDYVVDFNGYSVPFPNFAVQEKNVELYKNSGVTAVFHQCINQTYNSDFAQLKSYYLSRQLWDIDIDVEKLIGKYLVVTYGDAAPYVAKYLDDLQYNLCNEASDLDLYDSVEEHRKDYLSKEHIEEYALEIQNAYNAVSGNETLTKRIKELETGIWYAKAMCRDYERIERYDYCNKYLEVARENGMTFYCEEWVGSNIDNFVEDRFEPEIQATLYSKLYNNVGGFTGIVAGIVGSVLLFFGYLGFFA